MKTIFVTVGSTHFDALIDIIDSTEFIELARDKGYDKIIVQHGNYHRECTHVTKAFDYAKPAEIKEYFNGADLVIGHAGAGTILEVLGIGKPLFVVVNDSLMDNHQTELARALKENGVLVMSGVSDFLPVFSSSQFEPHTLKLDPQPLVNQLNEHFQF